MHSEANFRQKTNVTLKMILEAGILLPGLELVCPAPGVRGILNSDGSITVHLNGKEKVCEYLSGAARVSSKVSVNGWIYWSAEINGQKYSMDSFREKYLEKKG